MVFNLNVSKESLMTRSRDVPNVGVRYIVSSEVAVALSLKAGDFTQRTTIEIQGIQAAGRKLLSDKAKRKTYGG